MTRTVATTKTMKMIVLLLAILIATNAVHAWMTSSTAARFRVTTRPPVVRTTSYDTTTIFPLYLSNEDEDDENSQTTENPCWQDLYDDDCSMSNMYAASFVASKWIKSMPCAQGVEDCDMQTLASPGMDAQVGPIEEMDVRSMLGLKVAKPLVTKQQQQQQQQQKEDDDDKNKAP